MYSTIKITEERSIGAVIDALADPHPLTAYITELESVLGGSASTLLIALERRSSVSTATDVFSKAVTPRGYWQLQALEVAKAADSSTTEIFRLTHTSRGPER